mmetsp:Transcript_37179/g.105757  ORF Transcript_37179/g.105757 Transcript_37179/m.105757 type:complete len:523 (-) Transcript_37179:52-1620(-)
MAETTAAVENESGETCAEVTESTSDGEESDALDEVAQKPLYGCPRCGARYHLWKGMRLHMRSSPRCRSSFEMLGKKKMQRKSREAASAIHEAALLPLPQDVSPSSSATTLTNLPSPSDAALSAPAPSPVDGETFITPPCTGVGASVMTGRSRCVVVAEDRRCWRLADGSTIRKAAEGRRWHWCAAADTADRLPSDSDGLTRSDASATSQSVSRTPKAADSAVECAGVGSDIMSVDGKLWGLVVAEEPTCWRLADGRMAKKSNVGRRWRWAKSVGEGSLRAGDLQGRDGDACSEASEADLSKSLGGVTEGPLGAAAHLGLHEAFLTGVCDFLPLDAALRLTMTCRTWGVALVGHVPLMLPPPQVDALLRFCLLEVLVCFDEGRLPLPISALYSEMRAVGRRAVADPKTRVHLEDSILREQGPACKTQQAELLRKGRPHHVHWQVEIKSSGFKSLERLARHFSGSQLIQAYQQRWHKRIHHSPNTRTCMEWLLTRINRSHPCFQEHERWAVGSRSAAQPQPVSA